MPTIEESVIIARPPQEVFDFVSTPANTAVWDSSVVASEQQGDGPFAEGTRTRGTSKIMGRRFDWTVEATEYDPPNRVTNTSVEGPMSFVVTSSVEAVDGGSRYTYRIDAASGLGGVFGRMADPFIQRAQARTVRANLETLAELLAEHPAG
ncbi:SRPBCC family protein [Microterricola viridarii]|uniref:Ligand-binding SRPBCC domain-containing protein n=1 Tax=Microterricola viridarii TaxID=412690 RepID=A0A1H1TLL2_9MICO|nr:SRPBCC family protein [Microterricola viridarii]SDS61120.1 Ligand-binding SRPBCC domain-containing protein [Microterricola viridarii]